MNLYSAGSIPIDLSRFALIAAGFVNAVPLNIFVTVSSFSPVFVITTSYFSQPILKLLRRFVSGPKNPNAGTPKSAYSFPSGVTFTFFEINFVCLFVLHQSSRRSITLISNISGPFQPRAYI